MHVVHKTCQSDLKVLIYETARYSLFNCNSITYFKYKEIKYYFINGE